jgi:hypothetical protein
VLAIVVFYPAYRFMLDVANPLRVWPLTALVFMQMIPIAVVFGPFAAYLVEAFPARVRYTSISLPFNLANGWFGGFLPLIATTIVARTGNPLAWLAYPIAIAVMSLVVSALFATERFRDRLSDEVGTRGA